MSDIEFELKKRFAELREDDEANAPSFAAVRDRGRAELESVRPMSPRRRWIAPALAAAAAAVLAAAWISIRVPSRAERARQEALLHDSSMNVFRWTMPTDGLLTSARRSLQTPALSASVLDGAAVPIPGTPFKGD
jgi:hypothetical protein